MSKYHNKEFTKKVGLKIEKERKDAGLEIEDISEMTGFHRNVILSIENGSNTDISHLAEVAFALNLHPKVLFDVNVIIKPRFKLSAVRREKSRITARVLELYNTSFFNKWRSSKDVQTEMLNRFPDSSKIETKNISVILNRLKSNGQLITIRKNNTRFNLYKKSK